MILMSLALGGKVKLLQDDKMRAEVTAQIKGHLLRIISHDIANPLTVVKGHSRRLQKDLPANRSIESIVRGVNMIEEIMHFVRKTEALNQGMAMSMTSVSLAEVFAKLTFLFEEKARDKGIELKFSLESPDLAVHAEKVTLSHEVLGNLLSNAIKFSSPGGTVRLDARRHESDSILITVQDQGVGMSRETLSRLFDPHQNRSEPGTAGEQGIGYGMPLAKALLDAYAAMIEVDSTPVALDPERCGTIFRIFIRAAKGM
ncbi:MAG TPA: HAMP domain-containing sensor histidine kinase [Oligoflexus sp.]|uniref:sensor histidine kinase n=1 Tax=Oligoflexus sp. TaxID=1971216 RepID=UPI002D2F76E9|nr:HAMP domain-containing sensor histidine kinase [Oligoflexus sp.]HYX32453.1 HAMP domain-containing sensor histidine kinase [Oligoflexus sp.]